MIYIYILYVRYMADFEVPCLSQADCPTRL